jgi:hypothetical protein
MSNIIEALNVYNVFSPKMRLGDNRDGGYIINETIAEVSNKLITVGLGSDYSFERDWYNKFKTPIEVYDGTCSCGGLCHEFKDNINKDIFFIKNNVGYDEGNMPINVLLDRKSDILLKVDAEGSEYTMFDNVKLGSNIAGFILEVHDIHVREHQEKLISLIENQFSDLLLFHIHGNSWGNTFTLNLSKTGNRGLEIQNFPHVLELSFVNKRLLGNFELETTSFPIQGLDYSNHPDKQDIQLPWINAL